MKNKIGFRKKVVKYPVLMVQKKLMEKHYSYLTYEIEKNVLTCTGWLQPEGCKTKYKIKIEIMYTILFSICVLVFFSYNFRKGWSNYNVFNQTEVFAINKEKGQLMLDAGRVAELGKLRPYLYNNDCVMTSHENMWGYIYLNNATPLYLPFRFKENYFYYYIKKHDVDPTSITYVELKRKPFPESFKKYLSVITDEKHELEMIDLDQFMVYQFKQLEHDAHLVDRGLPNR